MSSKNYKLKEGECSSCCLLAECSKRKEDIKKFLLSLGVLCEYGKCVEVINETCNTYA